MLHYIIGTLTTLLIYYGMFLYIGTMLINYFNLPFITAWLIPLPLFLLQYIFSPLILDTVCSPIDWQSIDTKFPELEELFKEKEKTEKIRRPRLGISSSTFPMLCTYGHHYGNCRIVVSSSLLEALNPVERKFVIAHEITHAKICDFIPLMCTGLIPFSLFLFSWNLLTFGIGMRELRGLRSLASSGLALWWLAKMLYFFIYFASRGREIQAHRYTIRNTTEQKHCTLINEKIRKAQTVSILSGDPSLKKALALNFLGNFDPWISYHEALHSPQLKMEEAHLENSLNPWNSYYNLFSSHPIALSFGGTHEIPEEEKESYRKLRRLLIGEILLFIMPFISIVFGFLLCHLIFGSIGFTILLWGLTFLLMLIIEHPRIKSSCENQIPNQNYVSALSGIPLRVKGSLSKERKLAFFPHLLLFQNPEIETPVKLISFCPAEIIYEDIHPEGELEISGWLRRNPYKYIEVREIHRTSGRKIFGSYYLLFKYFIAYGAILLGLFLIALLQREG